MKVGGRWDVDRCPSRTYPRLTVPQQITIPLLDDRTRISQGQYSSKSDLRSVLVASPQIPMPTFVFHNGSSLPSLGSRSWAWVGRTEGLLMSNSWGKKRKEAGLNKGAVGPQCRPGKVCSSQGYPSEKSHVGWKSLGPSLYHSLAQPLAQPLPQEECEFGLIVKVDPEELKLQAGSRTRDIICRP